MTPLLDRYLSEVDARLPGPARDHPAILAELRSGLLDATDVHEAAGLPRASALAAAIGEFGEPGLVADGFRDELAATQSRRVAVCLRVAAQLVVIAAGVTAIAALTGIAATGRLTRWLPARPRRAPTAAAIAGLGAVGADSVGLVLLTVELAIGPARLSPAPATAAAVASLARIVLARRAAQHCLAVRATLAVRGC